MKEIVELVFAIICGIAVLSMIPMVWMIFITIYKDFRD